MVWVSLCRVYLAVSLALNDRSPTGRFAFVSSFLDHRHLVTGVTSCIDYEDDTSLSLSLSFARKVKRKRGIWGWMLFQRAWSKGWAKDRLVTNWIVSNREICYWVMSFEKISIHISDSEWIFIRSRDDRYCAERFIIPGEIKIASTIKKNLKNLEKILIQTRISIHTTFLDTRVME